MTDAPKLEGLYTSPFKPFPSTSTGGPDSPATLRIASAAEYAAAQFGAIARALEYIAAQTGEINARLAKEEERRQQD